MLDLRRCLALVGLATVLQGCECDAILCESGTASITIRSAKKSGVLPPGTYTWSVTTSNGELFEGQCEIGPEDTQCDAGTLSWKGSDALAWTLFVGEGGLPQLPASAEVDVRHDGQVLFDGTYEFDYEPTEPARCDPDPNCVTDTLRLEV